MKFEFIYYILFLSLTLIAFIVRTLRNAFYLSFLWQIKEYRIDRMLAHLATPQGKKLIFGLVTLIKWFLLIIILRSILSGYIYTPETTTLDFNVLGFYAYLLFTFVWIGEAFTNIWELFTRGWKLPVFTPKIIFILGVVFILEFNFFFTINFPNFIVDHILYGPFYDKALAPLLSILMILFALPSFLYKRLVILKAKRKISRMEKLVIIGITGSFGKTSTKEFLASILSQKYKIAKTPASINTDVGIAKYIFEDLRPEHEILVVEMGAYKMGEVGAICDFINPHIGIITGINEQHIELFGSLQNTMRAKYELIKSLRINGLAVFNIGNKHVEKMRNWVKEERKDIEIIAYQREKERRNESVLTATNITANPRFLSFNLNYREIIIRCKTKLAGIQNIDNILAASAVAFKLGMTKEQIKKGIENLSSPAKTMKIAGSLGKLLFIDDSFNANPDGIVAALEYMKLFTGKKILVLNPIIELGKAADKIHRLLGRIAAQSCDLILLTNLNYYQSFIRGTNQIAGGKNKVQVVNTIVGERIIKQNIKKDGVVIFEGREAGKILEKLLIIN